MNKIIKNIFIIIALIGASCSEDFIDVPPLGQLTSESFEPIPAVMACYNSLSPYEDRWANWEIVLWGDICSDDAWKGGSNEADQPDFLEMMYFTTVPSNGLVYDHWRLYYKHIGRFNTTHFGLQNMDIDENLKKQLLAEVKYLRADHYFKLTITFGDIPLVLEPPQEYEIDKTPRAGVFTYLEEDLQYCTEYLPKKSGQPLSERGRATWGAAMALLTKVYLWQGKWAEAETTAEELINSQEYDLEPDFADIFKEEHEHGIESIWEINYASNPEGTNAAYYAVAQRPRQSWGGWGLNNPTTDLLAEYEEGDPRIIWTFLFTGDVTEGETFDFTQWQNKSLMQSRKVWVPVSMLPEEGNSTATNQRVIRFADVLLMYAEAANENGHPDKALSALNKVRNRARNSGLTDPNRESINYEGFGVTDPGTFSGSRLPGITTTDKNQLRQAIWHERRCELAMEGHRFFDLVRQGRAGQVMRAFSAAYDTDKGKYFEDGVHEVFPIPQNEIDKTKGNLKQNPGY